MAIFTTCIVSTLCILWYVVCGYNICFFENCFNHPERAFSPRIGRIFCKSLQVFVDQRQNIVRYGI